MSKTGVIAVLTGTLMATGCVHTSMERTGRMRLDSGSEGSTPVMATMPQGFEEVAELNVQADGIATVERLNKHLVRRAHLLGCDGLVNVRVEADVGADAVCVKRREPLAQVATKTFRVLDPPAELLERAKTAGDQGVALYQVLAQVQTRPSNERAWALRWYLETYPQSPFATDVSALFEEVTPMRASPSAASVRGAPTTP